MLQIRDLSVSYGPVRALQGVSLSVPEGKLVCVIGSNGAGKTTLLRTISGLLTPGSGEVTLRGQSLLRQPPHRVARRGVGHVPENRRVFPDQSVQDNLILGAYTRMGKLKRDALNAELEGIYTTFPRLKERRQQLAGTLSGGEQQMLAIGRALMLNPAVLLLDEPSMGLAPIIIDEVFRQLQALKARGLTMLLVEQLAYRALGVADYGYVIEHGRIEIEGPAAQLRADPRVQAAYLGHSST
ncbi:MAG: ABC transporter ATP-binding protein [Verrucomicrobia bacterium]|nr:ABC transporter ATP-binding protein [Verrucomicrobiota bacterium]